MLQSAPPHLRHFIVHSENTMWCTSTPKDRRSLHGCRRCLGKELLLPSMALILMMFFMKVEFHSDFINRVAKHVFAVYLFEGALRQIVQNIVFDYSIYEGEWYWPLVNIAVALIAMVGCMSIDVLAQWMLKPFRKAALKMLGDIINISQKIFICY